MLSLSLGHSRLFVKIRTITASSTLHPWAAMGGHGPVLIDVFFIMAVLLPRA